MPLGEDYVTALARVLHRVGAEPHFDLSFEVGAATARVELQVGQGYTMSAVGETMADALDFSVPYKFVSPDGADAFEVDLRENMARAEKLEDVFQKR